MGVTIANGAHRGSVAVPRSKSHEHRLLIADFLSGDDARLTDCPDDADDIVATKRCLRALRTESAAPVLDCGESGSTRRFLAPVAAALGKRPIFKAAGRLAMRPQQDYSDLRAGEFKLRGDVSSQFVTGLLFALPLMDGDSSIRFTTPLESRGYVDLTLQVLAGAGIRVAERADGYDVPGRQTYRSQRGLAVEGDWSGAAFWYGMNALGSAVTVTGLNPASAQPDRIVVDYLRQLATQSAGRLEVSGCPDLFPVLAVVAAGMPKVTTFTGTRRLKLKESDRTAAMADVLRRLGVATGQSADAFTVTGTAAPFRSGEFCTHADHRIAMAIAVGATRAEGPLTVDNAECVAKSYPNFFQEFVHTAGV